MRDPSTINVRELVEVGYHERASDVFIRGDAKPVMRQHAKIKPLPGDWPVIDADNARRMISDMMNERQKKQFEDELEMDLAFAVGNYCRVRANIHMQKGVFGIVCRIIPLTILSVEELGLPPVIKEFSKIRQGLVLFTGPTGSGKTTSLAAVIDLINETRPVHIVTVEDPIEFVHNDKQGLITQREIGIDTHDFMPAMRASLREAPDVILVGEMRDLETIQLAITAAETGHLVFATLHTNNAAESIDRMIDVFPPGQQEQIRIQLANNLQAIISQQLLPRASGTGRVPANEVMLATPAVRNLIRENKSHQIHSTIQTGHQYGMISMDQCLRDLYLKGIVTLDEAMSRAVNQDELKKMIATPQAAGGSTPGGPGSLQPPGR